MGIDLATWRARIGLNYYHMCRPLQTGWRSGGGQLYQPGVASWVVGEVMNDVPLVLKGCMTVVALSLILQYVVCSWSKLKGRGRSGKVRCHWQGSSSQVKGTVNGWGTLLLKSIMVVIPLLLVIAGDVETNPGPGGPTLKTLFNALHPVRAKWYNIGLQLDISYTELDNFKKMYSDTSDLMREMLKYWLQTVIDPHPTWEAVVEALRSCVVNEIDLAAQLERECCAPMQRMREESNSSIKLEESEGVPCQATASSVEERSMKPSGSSETSTDGPSLKVPNQDKKTGTALATESLTTCTTRYSAPRKSSESEQKKPRLDTDTEPDGGSTSPSPSEGSQKPPFGCGCGKCTFYSFLESGCPTPIPSASSFPYLNVSGLTQWQQQELRGRLRSESQEIMIQFQKLVSATIKSFEDRCVPLDILVRHVMALGAFDPVFKEPQVPVFHHCFKELKAADTITTVFMILNNYFSFFNYHILEHIIEDLGTKEDKSRLQTYKEHFEKYAKKRIFECPSEFGPVNDAGHADIFVKLDSQYEIYTIAEIEVFCHKLSEIVHISFQGILCLCRIDKGCFELTFQVPSYVQQKIFPLSREQELALEEEGVIQLKCGKYHFLSKKHGIGGSDALLEKMKLYTLSTEVENETPRRQQDQSKPVSSYNSLLGVEVVGEVELLITNEATTFQWKDHGFMLHVPENALPKGVSEYLVSIKVSLAGHFELPKGYELVSAVYWVRTPGKFKKPVTIETQHCANFSDPSQLCFVHTSCAQKFLPYKFKVIDGGLFSLGSKYGVLSTTHFSGKGIGKKVKPGEHSCQYCAHVYFTVKHLQDHWYYCHFVVTKDLEMCLAAVKRKYQQEYDIAPPISFGGDHVALDIPDDGAQTGNGWEIKPLHKAHIKKDRVNNFSSESTWVPECVLLLKWKQKDKAPEPLEYKLKLLGTGDENDFFVMVHHPGSQHLVSMSSSASSLQTDRPTAEHQNKLPAVGESPRLELTTDDILDVKRYLLNLGHTDIHYLGLTLGLNHLHLKKMREDSDTFKEDMIAAWLQKEDQVTRRGLPTWETLVKALRDDQVKQNGVADNIASDKNLPLLPEIIDSSS